VAGADIFAQADAAAGRGMHDIELEAGPLAIDDEDSESFYQRWLSRLVQAYKGTLRSL